jgi:adenylate cyclase
MPAEWSSFFDDSTDDLAQLSPGFARPGTGSREDSMGFPMHAGDDRRPSVASAHTVSSTGSKSSISRGGFHKRLQNVFGEDFPVDGRQSSDASLNTQLVADAQSTRSRNRGNSLKTIGSYHSRPASPTSLRPRTPQPSSEVTPWDFQESRVSLSPSRANTAPFPCLCALLTTRAGRPHARGEWPALLRAAIGQVELAIPQAAREAAGPPS